MYISTIKSKRIWTDYCFMASAVCKLLIIVILLKKKKSLASSIIQRNRNWFMHLPFYYSFPKALFIFFLTNFRIGPFHIWHFECSCCCICMIKLVVPHIEHFQVLFKILVSIGPQHQQTHGCVLDYKITSSRTKIAATCGHSCWLALLTN